MQGCCLFLLSWESTTVVLNLIKTEKKNLARKEVYKKVFYVAFFIVRICFGYYYSVHFLRLAWSKVEALDPTAVFISVMNLFANALNGFWFYKLTLKALSPNQDLYKHT